MFGEPKIPGTVLAAPFPSLFFACFWLSAGSFLICFGGKTWPGGESGRSRSPGRGSSEWWTRSTQINVKRGVGSCGRASRRGVHPAASPCFSGRCARHGQKPASAQAPHAMRPHQYVHHTSKQTLRLQKFMIYFLNEEDPENVLGILLFLA